MSTFDVMATYDINGETFVVSRYGRTSGFCVDLRGNVYRSIENHKADGTRDNSRSHYTINGRAVGGALFRRRMEQTNKRYGYWL